ncbi:hypothetical protein [Micromonospora globispora]|nr:hypothetical protein [Micromonospora globispora]
MTYAVNAAGAGMTAPLLFRMPRRPTTYRVPSFSATAGRMMSSCRSG